MKVRQIKCEDYGFSKEQYHKCIEYIRSNSFNEDKILIDVCLEIYPDETIARKIYRNIVDGVSYKKLEKEIAPDFLYIAYNDFYSYRRKITYTFMQRTSRWKKDN